MYIKTHTEFIKKNLFFLLVFASFVIHVLIIFFSPQASQILTLWSIKESFVREPDDYAITLELEESVPQKENKPNADTEKTKEKKDEEAEEKKYKTFLDTSENQYDEETITETDKIGEKGAIAKDNYQNSEIPVKNKPHSEGHSDAPFLGKRENDNTSPYQQEQLSESMKQRNISEANVSERAFLPNDSEEYAIQEKPVQTSQNQSLHQNSKEETEKTEQIKKERMLPGQKNIPKNKNLQPNRNSGINRREIDDPSSYREEFSYNDEQVEFGKQQKTIEEPQPSPIQELEETAKESEQEEEFEKTANTEIFKSGTNILETKIHENPERELKEQENPVQPKTPRVAFNVNGNAGGSSNEPVLFEDTISNAEVPGSPSFQVKKHEYAAYFKHIRDRISLFWYLGYGTRAEIKLETEGNKPIIVEFKVLPDGSIEGVKIVDDANNFPLASRLKSSIKNAAPLKPFPPNIKEPAVDVRFNFYFF